MSSFVCNPEHFGAVCNFVVNAACYSMKTYRTCPYKLADAFPMLHASRSFARPSCDVIEKEAFQIFDTLLKLQITCVSLQYAKHDPEGATPAEIAREIKFLTPEYKLPKYKKQLSEIEAYKALQCIGYQIETSYLEKLRPLDQGEKNALEWLDLFENELAAWIVSDLEAYKQAVWSI